MKKLLLLLILLMVILLGCKKDEVKSEIYKGQSLVIAVVGERPEIREENIDFKSISLMEINQNTKKVSSEFDAIFIMSEVFSDADDDKYVKAYQELTIPTFFIGTKKLHLPFVNEDITYESAPTVDPNTFAVGYLYRGTDKEYKDDVWRYHLYKDVKNDVNIKDVYTNIFKTIDELTY